MRGLIVTLALVLVAGSASAASLSPADWPAAERKRLEAMGQSPWPTASRTVEGRVLVSATLSPIAVRAGMAALDAGGTAADAAVATALTHVATDGGAVVSYAGVAQLLYYEARTRKVYVMDAGWGSYRGETAPRTIPASDLSLITGLAIPQFATQWGRGTLTPGFMAGMEATHRRFGRLDWASLFQPAIWYAEQGITVSPRLAAYFRIRGDLLAKTESGRRFLAGGGHKPGDTFRQPEVAGLLRDVARDGSAAMYRGPWAGHFVETVQAAGGKVTAADLAGYAPRWREPVSTVFQGAQVFGPPADNESGCRILAALNLLEAAGTSPKGAYWQDPAAFRLYAQTSRFTTYAPYLPKILAFEREAGFDGCAGRLTPAYARAAAPHIDELLAASGFSAPQGHHSDSVVVVDRWGNVAALVHSGNSVVWGDTGLVVDGVPLPSPGGIYQAKLATVRPGDPVPSDMSPVIALRHGRPVFAAAAIGASLAPETLRLAAALLAGSSDPAAIAAAPALLLNTVATEPGETIPQGGYDPAFLAELKAAGIPLREEPTARVNSLRGTAAFATFGRRATTAEAAGVMVYAEGR